MKRVTILLIALFACGLVFFEFATFAFCDGWYDLTVEIDSDVSARVAQISYVGAHDVEMSDACIEMVEEHPDLISMEHRKSADSFTVSIGFSYRMSPLGRTWSHGQEYSHLIVVLYREDGTRAIHRLPVPNRNISRRVVVSAATAT